MAIEFSGTITRSLFLKAQLLHMRWRMAIPLVFPLVAGIAVASGWMAPSLSLERKLGAVAASCLFPILMWGHQYFQWSRTFAKSPYLRTPFVGRVSDQALEMSGGLGDTRLSWDLVVATKNTDDILLVYQSPVMLNVLSRSFFASDADWVSAREIIASKRRRPTKS